MTVDPLVRVRAAETAGRKVEYRDCPDCGTAQGRIASESGVFRRWSKCACPPKPKRESKDGGAVIGGGQKWRLAEDLSSAERIPAPAVQPQVQRTTEPERCSLCGGTGYDPSDDRVVSPIYLRGCPQCAAPRWRRDVTRLDKRA